MAPASASSSSSAFASTLGRCLTTSAEYSRSRAGALLTSSSAGRRTVCSNVLALGDVISLLLSSRRRRPACDGARAKQDAELVPVQRPSLDEALGRKAQRALLVAHDLDRERISLLQQLADLLARTLAAPGGAESVLGRRRVFLERRMGRLLGHPCAQQLQRNALGDLQVVHGARRQHAEHHFFRGTARQCPRCAPEQLRAGE